MSASPGIGAAVDQILASNRTCLEGVGDNSHLLNDERVEAAFLRVSEEPWEADYKLGFGFILWGAVADLGCPPVRLAPGADLVAQVRERAPSWAAACDLCGSSGPVSWLPLPDPPHVVALAVCDGCAGPLRADFEPVQFVTREQAVSETKTETTNAEFIRAATRWLTVREICDRYDLPEKFVRSAIERRRVTVIKLDLLRVDPESWEQFLLEGFRPAE